MVYVFKGIDKAFPGRQASEMYQSRHTLPVPVSAVRLKKKDRSEMPVTGQHMIIQPRPASVTTIAVQRQRLKYLQSINDRHQREIMNSVHQGKNAGPNRLV